MRAGLLAFLGSAGAVTFIMLRVAAQPEPVKPPQNEPPKTGEVVFQVAVKWEHGLTVIPIPEKGKACDTTGRSGDTGAGIPISIYAAGEPVASARVDGLYVYDARLGLQRTWDIECHGEARVSVPRGEDFYSVRVGNGQDQTFSEGELFAGILRFTLD